MTSFLISAFCRRQKYNISVTFLFLDKFSSNFAQEFKFRYGFLFLAQEVVVGTILNDSLKKLLFLFLPKHHFEKSVTMATPLGDQNLFEIA